MTDDERIEHITHAFSYVPLSLYDEVTKLGEIAYGEFIAERNKALAALRHYAQDGIKSNEIALAALAELEREA